MNTARVLGRGDPAIPVAEYVRMSTDLQTYSPLNQSMAIAAYAREHGMRVVRSYFDEGRSGLDIGGRDALRRLITDVQSGHAAFDAVLVFDVSRWGRFQNSDEAAYYEFLCIQAGIRVCYVAEPFDNDGSPLATILKGLKRTMAAEYSRELSAKVYAGQCRLSRMGFRQGGVPGYGMRRMLVDSEGRKKGILRAGQRKSLSTDRVILVPGPRNETSVVRRIFRQYVSGIPPREIAMQLNAEGVGNYFDGPWNRCAIRRILLNEKYIGNNVFSRNSQKLRQPSTSNPPSAWVRKDAAFVGIVSPDIFQRAGELLRRSRQAATDEQMLDGVRKIIARDGRVSLKQINAEPGLVSSQSYIRRFGSMRQLYEVVGYKGNRNLEYVVAKRRMKGWRETITSFIVEIVGNSGSFVVRDGWTVQVDKSWSLAVCILPASRYEHRLRWFVRHVPEDADIIVLARMALDGAVPLDYVILPRIAYTTWPPSLYETNGPSLEAFTYPSLAVLVDLARSSASGCRSCG